MALAALMQGGAGGLTLVEQELPRNMPLSRLDGVKIQFRGGRPIPDGALLGPVATGEVNEDQAAAAGFPDSAPRRRGYCPEVFNAALMKLAAEARARGANAVVDVHSVDPAGQPSPAKGPSYLCMARVRLRGDPVEVRLPPYIHSVSLEGTAVRVAGP